ncbi:hypothetical protein A1F99_116510 [Pyrenophora tritici-repentis]|nr:hypothetical protein A1F99_116510 [Pyrenophora tritici-repentis]
MTLRVLTVTLTSVMSSCSCTVNSTGAPASYTTSTNPRPLFIVPYTSPIHCALILKP